MIVILFMLSGKYDGVYLQFNKCLSLLTSIILTKILLYKLIPILIPYLGLTIHIKAITFYFSVVCFYFLNKLIINIILFKYEPSKKNTIIQSIIGMLLGIINGILIISFVISITLYTLSINEQILIKLNNSILFQYIYDINLILFNYAK
tara:strand:+ start:8567 stop:9013 length:447 start_codon:yes stop_codon:yes gene_type:complete